MKYSVGLRTWGSNNIGHKQETGIMNSKKSTDSNHYILHQTFYNNNQKLPLLEKTVMCETHFVEERERRRGREVERRKAEMRKHDSLDTNSEASSYTEEEESLLEEGARGGKGDCWLITLMLHCASMSLMRMFNICSQPVCITP